MKNKEYYVRNLPHFQPLGGTFFVTYCLAGSIPKEVTLRLQEEYEEAKRKVLRPGSSKADFLELRKKHFFKYDNILSTNPQGLHYLRNDLIAEEVARSLHFWDGNPLELICFCIMSNHVHVVIRLLDEEEKSSQVYLHKVMHSIKQFSAKKANKILGKSGVFWQAENFDYQVKERNELFRIISYVLDNPVKAGLCKDRRDWKWSYIKPEYNEFI